jgi:transcriptional regulator with XRE-family HTH domain
MGSEKFLKQFGIKIRELRIKKGWARKDLARHSGLSVNLISSVEKGRMDISLKIILQLMEGLGYTDDELLTSNI